MVYETDLHIFCLKSWQIDGMCLILNAKLYTNLTSFVILNIYIFSLCNRHEMTFLCVFICGECLYRRCVLSCASVTPLFCCEKRWCEVEVMGMKEEMDGSTHAESSADFTEPAWPCGKVMQLKSNMRRLPAEMCMPCSAFV